MDDFDHDEVPKMRRPSAERHQKFRNDLLTSTLKRGRGAPTPGKSKAPLIKTMYSTHPENLPFVHVKCVKATAKIIDLEDILGTEKSDGSVKEIYRGKIERYIHRA
jgi:hypothetical protein